MSTQKFFSFIQDGDILAAPRTKVIKAEAFSSLLEAKEVIEKAKEDAEIYRQKVVEEGELLKEEEKKAGYEAGMDAWLEQIKKLEEKIEAVHEEISQLVVPVALKAAKKIVGKELEINKEAIVDIVKNCLKSVTQHKKIVIFVSKDDLSLLQEKKKELKDMFDGLESLSIRMRDDITPGGCIIETEAGIINAELENQWQQLEQAFEKLMKGNKPS